MQSGLVRLAMLLSVAFGLGACAGAPSREAQLTVLPREPGRTKVEDGPQKPMQCVPYARDHSQVKIYGDAWTWWDKAAGKFQRSTLPQSGAVMVLTGYAGPERGHVAVVRKIISAREIRIDHANWLDDGSIYINDPVADVSAQNDWSIVKVWNIQTGAWGSHLYPVQGFIAGGVPPNTDSVGQQARPRRSDMISEADRPDADGTAQRMARADTGGE